jgi:nitrogenase molybdenum-iron protein beta chain
MNTFIDRPKYSCALGGALATLAALPRTAPIIHASPGCGLNLGYAIDGGSGYFGSGYIGGAALPSTNVCEQEIVFGGESRLTEQIEKTVELVDADLYVVVSGCMVEMIGDNIIGTAKRAAVGNARILAVETGGFKGNSCKGYDLILSELFRHFVEVQAEKDPLQVNVMGLIPAHDVFFRGNLVNIKALLGKLGLRVNTFFAEGDTLEDLKQSGNASLNIVLSDRFGVESARVFEEIHGTPYITTGLPIGAQGTELFLRQVSQAAGIAPDLTEQVIRQERTWYFKNLVHLANLYNDYDLQRYAVIIADSNYAPALSTFLAADLGFLPELAVINDVIRDDEQEAVINRFTQGMDREGPAPKVIFETNEAELLPLIKQHWQLDRNDLYYDSMTPAVIIGSSFEIDLAVDINLPILCVAYPVTNRVVMTRGYAGYAGGLTLAEDLISTLISAR